jgi:small ligand-binding sensory domain FIST
VRLLMRDAAAGERDLRRRLQAIDCAHAAGALLFQCVGRDSTDHTTFAAIAGGVPLVGFHGNGEIGPTAIGSHVHAFTAVFVLFRRRSRA